MGGLAERISPHLWGHLEQSRLAQLQVRQDAVSDIEDVVIHRCKKEIDPHFDESMKIYAGLWLLCNRLFGNMCISFAISLNTTSLTFRMTHNNLEQYLLVIIVCVATTFLIKYTSTRWIHFFTVACPFWEGLAMGEMNQHRSGERGFDAMTYCWGTQHMEESFTALLSAEWKNMPPQSSLPKGIFQIDQSSI